MIRFRTVFSLVNWSYSGLVFCLEKCSDSSVYSVCKIADFGLFSNQKIILIQGCFFFFSRKLIGLWLCLLVRRFLIDYFLSRKFLRFWAIFCLRNCFWADLRLENGLNYAVFPVLKIFYVKGCFFQKITQIMSFFCLKSCSDSRTFSVQKIAKILGGFFV